MTNIDIVIPVYNEGKTLVTNITKIDKILRDNSIVARFILVDDGSKDNSWEQIGVVGMSVSVMGIRLSRNFGKEAAVCAGVNESNGTFCAVMDADLQHPPEALPKMLEMLIAEDLDLVLGKKAKRGKESLVYKLGVKLFYKMLKSMSELDMESSSDFLIMRETVALAFKKMNESSIFFRGMVEWLGFKKGSYPFEVAEREDGTTRYGTLRLIKLAINATTSFSSTPLAITGFIGTIFFIVAIVIGVQTLYRYFSGISLEGFTTIILLILIACGAIMISLNIIGLYIARIYDEVKDRPRYIISDRK